MAYLLDANVFIAAQNLHYGFDFCPAFWDWIVRENRAGQVFSVERVRDEITASDDELARWVARLDEDFLLSADASTVESLHAVARWVNEAPSYTPPAKSEFLQVADYYLVAQAHSLGHIIVTHEKPENSRHRVKIPDVCLGIRVPFLNTFDMLRRERARFMLAPDSAAGPRM